MRHLPVYLTETDQDDAWRNENNGWVQRVYGEIDWWNRQPGNQVIRAVILYRWPNVDKWGIDGKAGVIEDFRKAMTSSTAGRQPCKRSRRFSRNRRMTARSSSRPSRT